MSPANFHHNHKMLNGLRPSPLKINKESHLIHKSSSSSSISTTAAVVNGDAMKQRRQRNHPIIIYTRSPKVIHTKPGDFMALVQQLTGLSQSKDDETTQHDQKEVPKSWQGDSNYHAKNSTHGDDDNNEMYSVLTYENHSGGSDGGNNICGVHGGDISPINLNPTINPNFADVPLFTPSSINVFSSPKSVYRYNDQGFPSPNVGNSISPSVLEFIKELPEY